VWGHVEEFIEKRGDGEEDLGFVVPTIELLIPIQEPVKRVGPKGIPIVGGGLVQVRRRPLWVGTPWAFKGELWRLEGLPSPEEELKIQWLRVFPYDVAKVRGGGAALASITDGNG